MAISETVGSIAGLWRFPVKSMRGEQLQEAELTATGYTLGTHLSENERIGSQTLFSAPWPDFVGQLRLAGQRSASAAARLSEG